MISSEELLEGLNLLGECMTEDEAEEMVRQHDVNGDGHIDYKGEYSKTILHSPSKLSYIYQ